LPPAWRTGRIEVMSESQGAHVGVADMPDEKIGVGGYFITGRHQRAPVSKHLKRERRMTTAPFTRPDLPCQPAMGSILSYRLPLNHGQHARLRLYATFFALGPVGQSPIDETHEDEREWRKRCARGYAAGVAVVAVLAGAA